MKNDWIIHFPKIGKLSQGFISVAEAEKNCPFPIKRVYWVYDCIPGTKRGGHAHKDLHQLLICINGEIEATLDDGKTQQSFSLNHPGLGLYQPPLIWGDLVYKKPNSILLVFASDYYNEDDYIRNYSDFIEKQNNLEKYVLSSK